MNLYTAEAVGWVGRGKKYHILRRWGDTYETLCGLTRNVHVSVLRDTSGCQRSFTYACARCGTIAGEREGIMQISAHNMCKEETKP